MAVENWSAEGGTNTTLLSTTNTGGASGLVFAVPDGGVSQGSGTPMTFSTTQKMHGSMGVFVTRTSGTAGTYVQRTLATPVARHVMRVYVYFPSLPGAQTIFARVLNGSNSIIASAGLDAANKLYLANAAGTTVFTATTAFSAATWYRVEIAVAPGTTTSTGAAEFAYYAGDATSATQTMTPITAGNFGTVNTVGYTRVGRLDGNAGLSSMYFDDYANESKGSGLIGPAGVVAPTPAKTTGDNTFWADLRTSTAGIGGALTYSIAWSAGEILANIEPVDGFFVFTKSTVGTSQYRGTVSETGGTSADILIDIPQLVAGTLVSYAPLMWNGSVWV